MGENREAANFWQHCRDTLRLMKKRGMHLDPPLVQLLGKLDAALEDLTISPKDQGHPDLLRETTPKSLRASPIPVSISTPHSAADPHRATELNIKYQQELARWQALPWWKRLKVKKPEPPRGI
jgi:hypothetical protein